MKILSSFSNTTHFRRASVAICGLFKRYTLLYDQVIFNRHGCLKGDFPGVLNVHEYMAHYTVPKEIDDNIESGKNQRFREIFIDIWDIVDDPETFHKKALSFVKDSDSDTIASFAWDRTAIEKEMDIHNDHRAYVAAYVISAGRRSDVGFKNVGYWRIA